MLKKDKLFRNVNINIQETSIEPEGKAVAFSFIYLFSWKVIVRYVPMFTDITKNLSTTRETLPAKLQIPNLQSGPITGDIETY